MLSSMNTVHPGEVRSHFTSHRIRGRKSCGVILDDPNNIWKTWVIDEVVEIHNLPPELKVSQTENM